MTDDVDLWGAASTDARLTQDERDRLDRVLADDETLREELVYLVEHLSSNLGRTFVREFVDLLNVGDRPGRPAGLVLPALAAVIAGSRPAGTLEGTHA